MGHVLVKMNLIHFNSPPTINVGDCTQTTKCKLRKEVTIFINESEKRTQSNAQNRSFYCNG